MTCRGCGRKTNTVFADHVRAPDGEADACYLAIEDGRWAKGCAYEQAPKFERDMADRRAGNLA